MIKVCVIGLGYVGLPILLRLSKKYNCVGFDNNFERIKDLNKGNDKFREFGKKELNKKSILYSNSLNDIVDCNLFIVTVPTPIYKNKKPDLSHLKDVCLKISKIIKKTNIIIFESTVYPGLTNNFCIPILEKVSKLKEGKDFFVGYSPERVNPGDKRHDLKRINKILAYPHSYKKKEILKIYSNLGKKIIFSNNIIEAETAKVIENIQRDVNIGLINEIYLACIKLNINFKNVNYLASTKWNFLNFNPGLVGGHCLPVDPYYFAYICKKNNFNTKITLAGRNINDSMTRTIVNNIRSQIKRKKLEKKRILICGLTYKENVSDLRNSLAFKIFQILKNKNIKGFDPLIDITTAQKNGIITEEKELRKFDIFILLTKHKKIEKSLKKIKKNKIFYPL
tara:strand:+ start:201 stop:1385 length:1185 start_codon:yes stop_codon:yes gene_type:complete